MENVESKAKLFAALAKTQSEVKAAGKSGENKFDNYKYAMLQDYWEAVQEPMAKNGLSFPVSVTAIERLPDRQTSKGGIERVVQVELTGYLCHESGEVMQFKCYGEGQDRSDKAIYKAVTGGKKYLIASVFNIPTTDDPEKDSDAERGDHMDQRRPEDRRPPATGRPQTSGNAPSSQSNPRQCRARGRTQPAQPPPSQPPQESDLPWDDKDSPMPENPNGFKAPPLPADNQLIGQREYDQIIQGLRVKHISRDKWLEYIGKEYDVDGAMKLTMAQFKKAFEVIYSRPEVIDPGFDA